MRWKEFVCALLAASCLLMAGCGAAPDRAVELRPTPEPETSMAGASASAAPSETPYFFADLDLNRAVPRQFAVRPMDPEAYRVERYELSVPTGAPIALAHVLDGMQCVLYVGTDEAGCQYIAALELPGGGEGQPPTQSVLAARLS